jgi:threonine dehydrogenase-like Zn-dependent dehydrogenase
VIVVGVPGLVKNIDLAGVFFHELNIRGSHIYHNTEQWQGQTRSTYDITLEMMESGQLDIGWMVSRRYPLEAWSQALREIGDKRNNEIIKAVFEF